MPPECSLAPTYDPFSIDGFYIGFAEAVNLSAPTRPVTRRVTSSTTTTRLATASDRPTQPSLTVPRRDRGRLRDLIHGVDPDMTETIKRRDQPYFVLDGNVCARSPPRITLTSSSTTAPSSLTPTGSSPVVTTTRPQGPSPTVAEKPSTRDL